MCWLTLDPTSVCVVLLIITLTALWAYVTIAKDRTRLPNLTSVLREVSQNSNGQTGNRKAPKKRKQVDGNSLLSKVASKDVQKVLPATNDASSGVKVQPLPTPEARSSIDSVSDTTEQVLQKGREEKKEEEVKPKHSKEKKKTKSGKSHVLKEGGEWQTQLSRPQLRALRQKQRTDEHKESQEAKNSVATEGNSNSELEKLAGVGSVSGSSGSSECMNGDSSGINKNAVTSDSGSSSSPDVTESSDDRVKGIPGSQSSQSSTGMTSNPDLEKHGSLSPELFLGSSLPVMDVETALVEAACSSVSSIEEEKSSGPDATTKKKKRKSRRKNKQGEIQQVEIAAADSMEPEAVPDSSYNQEEWVVIN